MEGTTLCSALSDAVPDSDGARYVAARDIEAGGREAGDGRLGGVRSVLRAEGRIVDGAEEDGFVRLEKRDSQHFQDGV